VRRRRASDVAPAGPVALPATGLGRGWEPAMLMTTTLLLLCVGLVSLYSASSVLAQSASLPDYYYFIRQAVGAGIGVLLLVAASQVPYRLWQSAAWPLIVVSFLLLVVVILPGTEAIAPKVNGARRWLTLGITFQPSDVAKLAVIAWTSMMAVRKQEQDAFPYLRRGLGPFLLVWAMILVPILLEPNLSTAVVIAGIGCVIVFAAGARISHFLFLGVLVSPVVASQLLVGFRIERLKSFLHPLSDPGGAGFQVRQSLIAIGSGGVSGLGYGQGRQKFGFLPEAETDFIFAIIGEEWGLLGVLVLVALYTSVTLVGFRIARRTTEPFGQLLAVGLTSMIAMQAFLHMAIGLGLLPTTGVGLPLVSWGRSNLLMTMVSLGILLSIARTTEDHRGGRSRGSR
jgi:cell division protein FtsW